MPEEKTVKPWPEGPDHFTKTDVSGLVRELRKEPRISRLPRAPISHPGIDWFINHPGQALPPGAIFGESGTTEPGEGS